jgi:hypothetical protein
MLKVVEKIEKGKFHLNRPLPLKELEKIVRNAKEISMSESTYKRLSKASKLLIGDRLVIEKHSGRALSIKPELLKEIKEMRLEGFTLRKIQDLLNVPKSTLHYLINKAKARKIRVDGKIVHTK